MITALPDAPEGSVTHLLHYSPSDFPNGSAVLCRNVAPLVAHAYALLRNNLRCCILGRDIGAQLVALVRKQKEISVDLLQGKLRKWANRETARLFSEGRALAAERVNDQFECLLFFCEGLTHVDDVIAKIMRLFTDDGDPASRITLSTIHKAKGLEYPRVMLLDFFKLLPSKYATLRWQKEQERNLQYVAVTRAMSELVYISSDCWKEEA